MLQAFQPPLDLSQDVDDYDGLPENISTNHDVSRVSKSSQLTSTNTHVSKSVQAAEAYVVEGSNTVCNCNLPIGVSTKRSLHHFCDYYVS